MNKLYTESSFQKDINNQIKNLERIEKETEDKIKQIMQYIIMREMLEDRLAQIKKTKEFLERAKMM
jgi:mRNA-degrading endonuclease YafQ of YafQ-DinJ toxin-antitoxin module